MRVMLLLTFCVVQAAQAAWAQGPAQVALAAPHDPPHNMQQQGRMVGSSTELVEEMFRRAGISYSLTFSTWPRAFQSARDQAGHCAFSMARLPEREAQFRWIGPIGRSDWVLYARTDDKRAPPASIEEVRGALIGSASMDAIAQWLTRNNFQVDATLQDTRNPEKLAAGRFDYWAVPRERGAALTAAQGQTGKIAPVLTFTHVDLYLGCHRQLPEPLAQKLSQALTSMRRDGTVTRIDARYAQRTP